MLTLSRTRLKSTAVASAMILLATLTACGGSPTPPPPSGLLTINGSLNLPAGHGMNLATLSVSTPIGVYPVAASGEFTADVFEGAATEIGVETADGDLLLLGTTKGATVDVSLTSTAEALLYYLVGGMWLPPQQQDEVRSLLEGVPEADALAAQLQRQLLAGGNGVADPDAGLLAALEAAHASLVGDAQLASLRSAALAAGAPVSAPAAVEGSNILITPGATVQAGVEVIHNPAGVGVVAQNHQRRPAALLAYETGWEDADGILTPNDPPTPVARVEVPATGQLELLNALLDVVTGDSPWSPVLSPQVNLPGHEGASRTHYQLVVVGPSGTDDTWPIMDDERFDIFHGYWEDIEHEKSIELFLDELLLPLIEVYGLGSLARFDAAKLSHMRDRVRLIHSEHLMGLGVYLRNRQGGYVNAMKYVLAELVENRHLQTDIVYLVRDALAESDKNKAAIDAMEKRLSSRASATAIAAAVQTLLVGGDVAKIMYDLSGSSAVVDWTAISAPTLFALTPERATVTPNNALARFTVIPKGETTGNFHYRWTTSGVHGEISDLLTDGVSLDTTSPEIWYFHDDPTNIERTDMDTITAEVFEVESGATSIPTGAVPVARMVAVVQGDDRNFDPRLELGYGATPSAANRDRKSFPCAAMYLRFDAVPDAKSYTVRIRGVGGQGHQSNSNEDFRLRGPDHSVFIDPQAVSGGGVVEDGYTPDWYGYCTWRRDGNYTLAPTSVAARYDRAKEQYVVHLFTNVNYSSIGVPVNLSQRVDLWHDWVENAIFEVVANK